MKMSMFNESSGWPISGSLMIGVMLYGVTAYFVTGQVVGSRTIEKSQWPQRCERIVHAQIQSSRPPEQVQPNFDCSSIMGLFGAQGDAFCRMYGPRFKIPGLDQIQAQQQRLRDHQNNQLAQAASQVGSRCACASALTLERKRTALALYAGSLRLVSSGLDLEGELMTSLRSQHCMERG